MDKHRGRFAAYRAQSLHTRGMPWVGISNRQEISCPPGKSQIFCLGSLNLTRHQHGLKLSKLLHYGLLQRRRPRRQWQALCGSRPIRTTKVRSYTKVVRRSGKERARRAGTGVYR